MLMPKALIAWLARRRSAGAAGHIAKAHRPRPGPPAIAAARRLAACRSDIVIDALETEHRIENDRLFVRAWLSLPTAQLPQPLVEAALTAQDRLSALAPEARQVFYLSASYGLPIVEIARLTGRQRRSVRRMLLRAIAALDRGRR